MDFSDSMNVVGLPRGSFGSLNGYASEYLAVGRALQCGYIVNFRAWRDAKYDLTIDYKGKIFRVEVKGSTGSSMTCTSGRRTGRQIRRDVESREQLLSVEECDFLIGITGKNCICYILPVEIIQIFNMKTLTLSKLQLFEEKWKIFMGFDDEIDSDIISSGFLNKSLNELDEILNRYNITPTTVDDYEWNGFRGGVITGLSEKKKYVLDIWKYIYGNI